MIKRLPNSCVPADHLFAVTNFLLHEARLLDDRCFEDWCDLFTEDARYWAPLKPDQTSPDSEASLFYDDKRMMETRIERLRHPNIHSQTPPHRTCHLVGNVIVEERDDVRRMTIVSSNQMISDYRLRISRLFSARVVHHLREEGDGFRISFKKVQLINCDDVFELIAVPF